ncbi:restriction endonuclease [Streptococcus pneumoniae]
MASEQDSLQQKLERLSIASSNIRENSIREDFPELLSILLLDQTKSNNRFRKNIIWSTDEYQKYGEKVYAPTAEILPHLITGYMEEVIKPRALKSADERKGRTKAKAEVFTPTWVVKKQNDEVDQAFQEDDLETYVGRTWLEITCGEGPYIASRYDMETGLVIPLEERVGFLDRKLYRINQEIDDKAEWQDLVEKAYQACYGFEWSGDSLFLARENLLYTYRDYYVEKWQEPLIYPLLKEIAGIISYNLFQMDGLTYTIPLSEKREKVTEVQLSLFDDEVVEDKWSIIPGKRAKVMNWKTGKKEFFDKGVGKS